MSKLMVDQRELEYLTGIPDKVIEKYTSEAYHRDFKLKRVTKPPLPMVEFGPHTKRFVIAKVLAWAEQYFSKGFEQEDRGRKTEDRGQRKEVAA